MPLMVQKWHTLSSFSSLQDTTGIPMHFWGVYDGHAGSGAALMASKVLQRIIRERLCDVAHLLENQNNSPPICLAKNGSPFQAEAKKGACLDGEEQDGLLNEPRFHMEKDISVRAWWWDHRDHLQRDGEKL